MHIALAFAAAVSVLLAPIARHRPVNGERIVVNDNRTPAGSLRDGVLTLRLEAREGEWHPDGDAAPGIVVRAFGEAGMPLSVPGPMIRVAAGTEIHTYVTNSFARPLLVYGLAARGDAKALTIAPGTTREVRFLADAPGTYYYRGVVSDSLDRGPATDAELSGAFIVDERGATTPARDRVLLISMWSAKPLPGGIIVLPAVLRFSINGTAWPNTERLSYTVGDTVRFRVINASRVVHPMHLHGFYFDVGSRGGAFADTVFARGAPPYRVVTERAAPGRTFTMTWVPERAGNWLFHCHDNYHVLRNAPLDGTPLPAEHRAHVANHATDMMGGLVMGIEVKGNGAPAATVASAPRRLRLVAQRDTGGTDAEPAYGYALHDDAKHVTSATPMLPGPVILLKRGEPVAITVVNRLAEPTAVHWHGIELESYFDGVADFSGAGTRIAHAIAPNDSFVARMTPPRSGTFMYHPHADELRQQQAGLAGVLLVVDDPATFDPTHDIVLLLTVPRLASDGGSVLVNGSLTPPPLELRVGERYRLRFADVHTYRPSMIARVLRDSSLVTWRALAKDGMDLPPERATVRPSILQMGNGETYDFELVPTQAGNLRLTMSSAVGALLSSMAIRVR